MDKEIEIDSVFNCNMYFAWCMRKFGFGQLHFYKTDEGIACNNECMSRERVRKILHAFADHIADKMILEDPE